jgi:hypothetical protein
MDALYWKPAWTDSTDEEFFAKLEQALEEEEWILDGNYSRSQPVKWRNVTMIVWVDYSLARTLWQAVSRAFRRSLTKEELWPGTDNRESFRKSFLSKDSIIWWTITSRRRQRQRYLRLMADTENAKLTIFRLSSPLEANRFLTSLEK